MTIDWTQVEAIIRDDRGKDVTGPGGGCPRPEDLAQLVERRMGRKARARMMGHVANCPECARILKSLLRLSSEVDRLTGVPQAATSCPPDLIRDKEDLKSRSLLGRRFALATVVSLVALAVVTVSVIRLSDRSVVRGAAGSAIKLITPKKGASIAARDITFRWEPVPKASSYYVEIFGRSLEKVWRSGPLAEPQFELPAEAREGLQAGGAYFWRVTAVREDAQDVVSKLAEFTIRK